MSGGVWAFTDGGGARGVAILQGNEYDVVTCRFVAATEESAVTCNAVLRDDVARNPARQPLPVNG